MPKRGVEDLRGQLLRYRNCRPVTARRYDYLWSRLGRHLSWVAAQQVTMHWLRHATLTWVERHFGYAVARAYAGYNGHSGPGATATYVRADLGEVAAALAAVTGEAHPMAMQMQAQARRPDPADVRSGILACPDIRRIVVGDP